MYTNPYIPVGPPYMFVENQITLTKCMICVAQMNKIPVHTVYSTQMRPGSHLRAVATKDDVQKLIAGNLTNSQHSIRR